MEKQIYRNGDILLKTIEKLPDNLKQIFQGKEFTVALGEITGHSHVIVAEPAIEVLEDEKGKRYIKINGEAEIKHQEHKTIKLKSGMYVIIHEQEFSPFDELINQVKD